MDKRLTSTLALAALAACLAIVPATAALIIAQNDPAGGTTAPPPAASKDGTLQPQRHPETPAEVAECMKTWDSETGMSKAEYEAACKRTLKYYPEDANKPPR